jgi:hypothetical protein
VNSNEPAYPLAWTDIHGDDQREHGLTKRELLAAMAMQGIAASGNEDTPEQRAMWAVRDADALLAELAKDAP